MKEYKQIVIDSIINKAKDERIISLRKTANELGYKHISAQDCRDIMHAVLKALPEYKAVQMLTEKQARSSATAGLFSTLNFVEKTVEFDNGEDL